MREGLLARALVEARLAACVQIVPIESVYRWDGVVECACEWLLLCKIVAADFPLVTAAISARHSYDVPEIVMMPIDEGICELSRLDCRLDREVTGRMLGPRQRKAAVL